MAAKDLGTKYTCFKCGTKFYDMRKPTPVCPKCGADQRDSPALKAPPPAERRQRAAKPAPAPAPAPAAEVEEVETEGAEAEDEAEVDDADEDVGDDDEP